MKPGGLRRMAEDSFHTVCKEVVETLAAARCRCWRCTWFKKERENPGERCSLRAIRYSHIVSGCQSLWAAAHWQLGQHPRKPCMLAHLLLYMHYWPLLDTGWSQLFRPQREPTELILRMLKLAMINTFPSCPHFSAIQRQESFCQVFPATCSFLGF